MSLTRQITTTTGKVKTITVERGDISKISSDAMITAINSGGMWFGGIDSVIQRYCDNQFHGQAQAAMPLQDKQTVVAKKKRPHGAMFNDVIFVVDDLKVVLNQIIQAGLAEADQHGYKTVSLPAIRTGVMLGVVERNATEAVVQLLRGIEQHFTNLPDSSVETIIFVIYEQGPVLKELEKTVDNLRLT